MLNECDKKRDGQILIIAVFSIIILCALCVLAIDVGYFFTCKAELQNAVDAAALAGASQLTGLVEDETTINNARQEAMDLAHENSVGGDPLDLDPDVDIKFGRYEDGGFTPVSDPDAVVDSIQVSGRRTKDSPDGAIDTFFGSIFGMNEVEARGTVGVGTKPRRFVMFVLDRSGSMCFDTDVVDGQNIVEIDESVQLPVAVQNTGSATVTGVQGTLSTSDPYVTLTESTENYGDIRGGGTEREIYEFDLADDCPEGRQIDFTLDISADSGSWTETFELMTSGVAYASHTIDDDDSGGSYGNDDRVLQNGEDIELPLRLVNRNSEEVHNVSASLSTSDSYVTSMSDSQENFGDIAAGGVAQCEYDYDFVVDSDCPDGHEIEFTLSISASEGSWTDTFKIPVQAVNVVHSSHIVDDNTSGDSSGDSDHVVDPGETVELRVSLLAEQGARDVSAQLSTDNTHINITDANEDYGDISGGNSAECEYDYDFEVASDCPVGETITFTLEGNGGWTDSITLTVGKPDVFYASHVIDDDTNDDSNGNDDGRADPGEDIELQLTLGSGTSVTGVRATLSSSSSYVNITDADEDFGGIGSGGTQGCSGDYEVELSDACPPGEEITFDLSISSDQGEVDDSFTMLVSGGSSSDVVYLNHVIEGLQEQYEADVRVGDLNEDNSPEYYMTESESGWYAVPQDVTVHDGYWVDSAWVETSADSREGWFYAMDMSTSPPSVMSESELDWLPSSVQKTFTYDGSDGPFFYFISPEGSDEPAWLRVPEGENVRLCSRYRTTNWSCKEYHLIPDCAYAIPDNPVQPIENSMDASSSFIDLLDVRDDLAGLITYSSGETKDSQLVDDWDMLQTKIYRFTPCGSTAEPDGMREAIDELTSERADAYGQKIMILLTDGVANKSSGNYSDTNQSNGLMDPMSVSVDTPIDETVYDDMGHWAGVARRNGIRIYCITFGSSTDQEVHEQIAVYTNGAYYYAENSDNLTDIFRDIFRRLPPIITR